METQNNPNSQAQPTPSQATNQVQTNSQVQNTQPTPMDEEEMAAVQKLSFLAQAYKEIMGE